MRALFFTILLLIADQVIVLNASAQTHPILLAQNRDGGGGYRGGGGRRGGGNNPPPDTTPPTISFAGLTSGATVSGMITVTANASDNVGITEVDFYLDNVLQHTELVTPYLWAWNTASSTNGLHTILARAADAAGNTASVSLPITIKNGVVAPPPPPPPPPPGPPTIPMNSIVTGSTTSTISLSWTASTETNGGKITGYKIFRGGVQVATAISNAYVNTGLTPATTYSYTLSSYDASGTNSGISSPITATTQAPTKIITSPNYGFGFSVGENLMGMSNAALNANLSDIAALGVGWIRIDIQWDHVQPDNSAQYDWSSIDQFVTAALAYHLKVLAIIDYTPSWDWSSACAASVGTDRCPPSNQAQYVTFAQAAVSRYASQISAWEIWNEPNLVSSWQPAADANAYTTLLKSANAGIKTVDPSAFIVSGSMGPAATESGNISPISFLTQLYADGGKSSFNAVGMHPYSYPAMPSYNATWNAWQQVASTSPSLRSIMITNGDAAKQIWLTEYGAPTGGPGVMETSATDTQFAGSPDTVTESLQSQMIGQAIAEVKTDAWAGPLFIYSYKDLSTDQSTAENFFGVIRFDGSLKSAYTTMKNMIAGN